MSIPTDWWRHDWTKPRRSPETFTAVFLDDNDNVLLTVPQIPIDAGYTCPPFLRDKPGLQIICTSDQWTECTRCKARGQNDRNWINNGVNSILPVWCQGCKGEGWVLLKEPGPEIDFPDKVSLQATRYLRETTPRRWLRNSV